VSALLERYAQLAAPLHRVVGRIAAPFLRVINSDGESRLGQLIADAHLAATRSAGATVAFVNPGGIRAPFAFEGDVTYSQVFDVYPFSNTLVTMTLTGAQLVELLEQQWQGEYPRVLQVSSGLTYAWNANAPPGSRIVRDSVMLDGRRLEPDVPYRVAVNSYIAAGGDRFTVLLAGADRTPGVSSREAIVRYLEMRSPLAPGNERRIRRVLVK
jgi:5'-nucleotidase